MVSIPVMGLPSSQCACSGQAPTTVDHRAGSPSLLSGVSDDDAHAVTDQVPLSPGRVRSEKVPISDTGGAIIGGSCGPVK